MAVALTLKQAAAHASFNVQDIFQGVLNLRTQLDLWIAAIAAAVPDSSGINARTVTNWVPPGSVLAQSVPTAKLAQTQADANNVSLYVYRVCTAAEGASAAGRITGPQASALLASYNAIIA